MIKKDYVDVHEIPALQKVVPLSLQHLFAMFGSTVLVPLLTGLDVSVALLTSGIGTLLFLLITKGKLPNYLGSSFAFIGPILTVSHSHGVGTAMLGCFMAGLVYLIVAAIVKWTGVHWLNRLLPPVVIASIIVVIGLSVSGVAVGWALNDPLSDPAKPAYTLGAVEVAFVTLAATVVATIFFRGFLSVLPVLTGMIVGYAYAAVRHPEWIDFAKIKETPWFISPGMWVNEHFITGQVLDAFASPGALLAALVIAPVAFVTLAEHIGHLLVTANIMNRDLMRDPGLHRSLAGDGVAVIVASFLGGPPSTTYGENMGVLALTKVYSRVVIAGAACFAILFAFIGKIGAFLMTIPKPVLGGVTIVLFGIIAAQGMRMYVEHNIDFSHKRNMVISAIVLVTGIGGFKMDFHEVTFSTFIANLTIDNIAMATFLGIFLHAVLPGKEVAFGKTKEGQLHKQAS
ncbi:uracil-xanthine permease family protein [Aneurinibacillus thermoaerophilus]|uniref:uracil-xanthine permease family protein n=1 Tax=Aneurinibacillus thermoaerophilus TaxID=143495 RepID=UPI002E1E637C|nr:solute carrier family 23 protein [Aneurinibacillus thermoaerophilus]MED0736870.1 solute carrier family 23 protein [Aneurinibacillus thermoaerophilus]